MIPYTPIDLPIELPDETRLFNYCINNTLSKNPNLDNGIVCTVGSMIETDDWRSALDSYEGIICDVDTKHLVEVQHRKGYDAVGNSERLGNFYYEPSFEWGFPELVRFIKQLPFKYFTGVFLMLAGNRDSIPHTDPKSLDNYSYPTVIEPSRYNIQLNNFADPKFYIQSVKDSSKDYVKLNKTYPCFAFNNDPSNFVHGADKTDKARMQLIIHGVLDVEQHKLLIERSINKFKGQV
jgi:hypothetical protein